MRNRFMVLVVLGLAAAGCLGEKESAKASASESAVSCDGVDACAPAYRHWRTIGVSSMSTPVPGGHCDNSTLSLMAADDGTFLQWIACADAYTCTTPTDLHFHVPDYASISDATLTLDTIGSGGDARASLDCLGAGGAPVGMVPVRTYGPGEVDLRWEVPLACFTGSDVVVRVTRPAAASSCIGPDYVALNVKSEYRRVPIAAITSPSTPLGTCTDACVGGLNEDDGNYLQWVACSSAYAYTTPTDLHFTVNDFASVTGASLTMDTTASGSDARAIITCISTGGGTLATILPETNIAQPAASYTWNVPLACFAGSDVIVRIARTGSNCLGPDYIGLNVKSRARAVYVSSSPTGGTCAGISTRPNCIDNLNTNDAKYLTGWMACSSAYGYDNPTDLSFSTPEYASVTGASLVVDTTASGSDARIRGSCVNAAGAELAQVFAETLFPAYNKTYTFSVPTACFTSETTRIRFTRNGSNCIGPDFVRLYTVSGVANGRVKNLAAIEGYTSNPSVAPGGTLDLRVHTTGASFTVAVVRYGVSESAPLYTATYSGTAQDPLEDAFRLGAGWSTSTPVPISATWASGLYAARLTSGASTFYVTFVVKEATPGTAPLALIASTNTWDAYNSWGGKSFYSYEPRDESGRAISNFVTSARPRNSASPYDRGGHTAGGERYFNEWLETNGYAYGELSDYDVHADPSLLFKYKAAIISTHSEYWTKQMYDELDAYLARGGNVLYMSGNGVYWKTTIAGDVREVRKDASTHAQTGEAGGLWAAVGRDQAATIGEAYDSAYYCHSEPYQVFAPAHWAFAGTGVVYGSQFGAAGDPGACGVGAAGWEIDRMNAFTPGNRVQLGQGITDEPADLLYIDHPGGGGVFSVGSINWGRSLFADTTLSRVTKNMVDRFTQGWRRVSIGRITAGAPSGTCGPACAIDLNQDDGNYLQWIACSSAYAYNTPTDFHFDVFDASAVAEAKLTLDTTASGTDARAVISCVTPGGATLATIQAEMTYSAAAQTYDFNVPLACFTAGTEVIVRVARTGANCLGPDWVSLAVRSNARSLPIESIPSATTCSPASSCLTRMNKDDRDYLQWIACAQPPGPNGSTEYGNPTDLHFTVSGFAGVTSAALVADLYGSGSDARVRVDCVNASGTTVLANVAPETAWPQTAQVYTWTVPAACFASSDVVLRFTRTGANCLGLDFARLLVRP